MTEIIDGDTIKVSIASKIEGIRIIGIDTPETVDPNDPVQCYGREASAKAKEMLGGKQVALVTDSSQGERDKYDRLLRYVEVGGTDYGLYMIANGFAHEYTYDKAYARQTAYKSAQVDAKSKLLGFWAPATCNGDTKQPANKTLSPVAQPTTAATGGPVSEAEGSFVTSKASNATNYYAKSDSRWLSEANRVWFRTVDDLLKAYPSRKQAP